jgi:Raf kinase inhibitor-like YbhB/YbcL family protein
MRGCCTVRTNRLGRNLRGPALPALSARARSALGRSVLGRSVLCRPVLGRPALGRPASRRGLAKLAILAVVIPGLSGCGLLGGLSGSRTVSPQSMTVTSPEFRADVRLPPQYTCAGDGLSPPLYWSGALSQQPKSFAVVVDDGLAPITPYVYWIVFDISPSTTDIAQNRLPTGAREAQNSAGTARYDPPCPHGSALHAYRFTVYALDSFLRLPDGAGLRATWSSIAKHVIGVGRLTVKARQ